MTALPMRWSVKIQVRGRSGEIFYREGDALLTFEMEMGGSDVIAIISGPHVNDWDEALSWAAGRKEEIMRRVADEAVKGPGNGCYPEFHFFERSHLSEAKINCMIITQDAVTYFTLRGSDLNRDGMYLELKRNQDSSEITLAEIFYSDKDGTCVFNPVSMQGIPLPVLRRFVEIALEQLPPKQ